MYPDGSQGGHLEFAAEAKLLPCENPLADNCLQRLCHQSTLTANSGNSNPICDGGDDGWVPLQHSAVPRFGQSGNSMSSSSTPGNVMVDQSKTYFELDFQGEMQPASSMYPFMYFGSTRRCYLQWNTTATGLPYLLPPDCVLTHQYADFPQGSSFTSELTNTGMPTMNDFNDYGSLSPPSQCQGTCCDSYMTGALAKPWDDFLSCEAEKDDCINNDVIQVGCERTCGMMVLNERTCIAPCEDSNGCCNDFDIGAQDPSDFAGFISCDHEIAQNPADACFNNAKIIDGCRLACGVCVPASYVEQNEFSSQTDGSFIY